MRKYNSLKTVLKGATLATALFVSVPVISEAKSFTDLNSNGTHNEAVQYLNNLNVYDYKVGSKLNGNAPITRGEVATMLHRYYGDTQPTVREYKNNFKDVNKNTPNFEDIIWSYEFGVFDGDVNGKFNPSATLTRAQMAKVLVNTFWIEGKETANFKDVSKNHWAYKYIGILQNEGITTGDGKGKFNPEAKVTLNQMSSFMYRIAKGAGETAVPEVSTSYKTLDELKQIAKDLYYSDELEPSVVVKTKTNLKEAITDYYFRSMDVTEDIQGYTVYGRTLQSNSEKLADGTYQLELWISSDRTQEEEKVWNQKMDKAAQYIKDNYSIKTDYDVVYAINDFIVGQLEYGMRIPDNHEFLEWRGNASTCTGYTDVAAELLKRFGIEHRYISGVATYNNVGHAWNAVKVGGNWYYLDTTFNDNKTNKTKYFLMTESERAQSATKLHTNFRATETPFAKSMAKPYTVK